MNAKDILSIVSWSIFIGMLGSGALTFLGALTYVEGFVGISVAAIIAICTALLFNAGWQKSFEIMTGKDKRHVKVLVLLIALMMLPLIAAVSTQHNVLAIAHKNAQNSYIEAYVGKAEAVSGEYIRRSNDVYGLLYDLNTLRGKYNDAAHAELTRGEFSGVAGPGAVHSALLALRQLADDAHGVISEERSLSEAKHNHVAALLEELRQAARDGNTKELPDLSLSLVRALSEMDTRNTAKTVGRFIDGMLLEASGSAKFSGYVATRVKQEAALTKLKTYVTNITQPVKAAVAEISQQSLQPLNEFKRLSGNAAVLDQWQQYMAAWAAGAALDFFPFVILLLFFISTELRSAELRHQDEIENINARTIEIALKAMEALRKGGLIKHTKDKSGDDDEPDKDN